MLFWKHITDFLKSDKKQQQLVIWSFYAKKLLDGYVNYPNNFYLCKYFERSHNILTDFNIGFIWVCNWNLIQIQNSAARIHYPQLLQQSLAKNRGKILVFNSKWFVLLNSLKKEGICTNKQTKLS